MKLGKSRFHGFPILGMMDRKAEDQSSSRTTTRAKPWYGCKDFVLFSIHHSLNLKFRSMFLLFSYWKLVDYHFFNPILPQNLLITNLNFRTKISKKNHCAVVQRYGGMAVWRYIWIPLYIISHSRFEAALIYNRGPWTASRFFDREQVVIKKD